jgi:hypothetical protein
MQQMAYLLGILALLRKLFALGKIFHALPGKPGNVNVSWSGIVIAIIFIFNVCIIHRSVIVVNFRFYVVDLGDIRVLVRIRVIKACAGGEGPDGALALVPVLIHKGLAGGRAPARALSDKTLIRRRDEINGGTT